MKNAIFQYMVVNEEVDKRGDIGEWKRSDLYQEVARLSRQSFESYADAVGADYYYSDEQVYTKGHDDSTALLFECLRVIYDPIFDQYDKVLFADTDIIANTREDIFSVSDAEVYGCLESDIRSENGGGYNTWDYKESTYLNFVKKFLAHDVPIIPAMPPSRPSKLTILNTGVVVWTKEARLKARELFLDWRDWYYEGPQLHMSIMNDQPYISGQLTKHDFDLDSVDQTWNDSPHYKNEDRFFESNFLHYTGGEWKLLLIDHYKRGKFKYVK